MIPNIPPNISCEKIRVFPLLKLPLASPSKGNFWCPFLLKILLWFILLVNEKPHVNSCSKNNYPENRKLYVYKTLIQYIIITILRVLFIQGTRIISDEKEGITIDGRYLTMARINKTTAGNYTCETYDKVRRLTSRVWNLTVHDVSILTYFYITHL